MKIDKRVLVLSTALAVLVLCVTASLAAAAVWKDKGTNVTSDKTITLTGGEIAEAGAKGLNCEIKLTLTIEAGSSGKVTNLQTISCTGFGELSKCELASSESLGLPWTVDVNATDLAITGWHTKRKYKAGCATTETDKTVGSVTVTILPTIGEMKEVEFLGSITGYKTFGSLKVDSPNEGTYGIG
jgi:FlaG/FlaF family flagellin (archaellin)